MTIPPRPLPAGLAPRALDGVTVLDLTHMLSGPYGTMLMADLGARTIKVEPPGRGEGTRRLLETDPDSPKLLFIDEKLEVPFSRCVCVSLAVLAFC